MNQFKFVFLRMLLNTVFVVLMCVFFLYGVNTNNFFQVIPATVLLTAGVAISVYNIKSKGIINAVAELAVCAFMYLCYISTIKGQYDILSSNFAFISIIRGLVTLAGALIIMRLCQIIIIPIIKYAEIYSIVYNTGIIASFVGCVSNFDSTFLIPFFNMVIRKSFTELFLKIKNLNKEEPAPAPESAEGAEETAPPAAPEESNDSLKDKLGGILGALKESRVGKASMKFIKVYAEYPDECVLAYCYKYPDMPIYKAVLQGIGIFIKNSPLIIGQIAAMVVMNYILKIIIIIITVSFILKHGVFTIINLFFYALLVYGIQFIITDVLTEFILMSSIIVTFLNKAIDETDDYTAEVSTFMPNLKKIKKIFGVKGEESVESGENDVTTEENTGNNQENEEITEENVRI